MLHRILVTLDESECSAPAVGRGLGARMAGLVAMDARRRGALQILPASPACALALPPGRAETD